MFDGTKILQFFEKTKVFSLNVQIISFIIAKQDDCLLYSTSGSQRCRCISTCPLDLKRMFSSSSNVRWRLHPGAVRPSLFTTRWHGNSAAPGEYLSVLPTILAWLGHPANVAISPYVVTLPRGICATMFSTSSPNLLACSGVILSG